MSALTLDMDRFWKKVDKRTTNECWEWIASRDRAGYGEFRLNGKTSKAHRVSYSIRNPQKNITGLCVLHKCDNPSCVNPVHLFLGTHHDNVADKCAKNRGRWKSHKGSENGSSKLTEENVATIRDLKGIKTQTEIAKMFGVSQANISIIHLNKGWKHGA